MSCSYTPRLLARVVLISPPNVSCDRVRRSIRSGHLWSNCVESFAELISDCSQCRRLWKHSSDKPNNFLLDVYTLVDAAAWYLDNKFSAMTLEGVIGETNVAAINS